jgi:hypothetical protein
VAVPQLKSAEPLSASEKLPSLPVVTVEEMSEVEVVPSPPVATL